MHIALTGKTRRSDERVKALEEIAARGCARPILNDLSEDEILGYDENGMAAIPRLTVTARTGFTHQSRQSQPQASRSLSVHPVHGQRTTVAKRVTSAP